MAYTRVTEEERKLIYRWRQDDISLREIALRLILITDEAG